MSIDERPDKPEEALKQIEKHISLIKPKYNPDGTLKKKE